MYWCDKFEREARMLSVAHVDDLELRTRVTELEARIRHLEVELGGERGVNEQLVLMKREVVSTVNQYVIKCEGQERDLFAVTEVNKQFEARKDQEFHKIKLEVVGYQEALENA